MQDNRQAIFPENQFLNLDVAESSNLYHTCYIPLAMMCEVYVDQEEQENETNKGLNDDIQ